MLLILDSTHKLVHDDDKEEQFDSGEITNITVNSTDSSHWDVIGFSFQNLKQLKVSDCDEVIGFYKNSLPIVLLSRHGQGLFLFVGFNIEVTYDEVPDLKEEYCIRLEENVFVRDKCVMHLLHTLSL